MKTAIATVLLAVIAIPVSAQGLETFLQSESGFIQYEAQEKKKKNFLENLLSRIGIRTVATERLPIGTTISISSTGYASSPYQTDGTPCTTGTGDPVRKGTAASNFLELGTLLEADVDGDGQVEEYIIEDRMSARFNRRVDFWFQHTTEALEHGSREIEITITGYGEPGDPIRGDKEVATAKPNAWQRIKNGFKSIGSLLTTQIKPDPNRFDIDCLSEEGEDE